MSGSRHPTKNVEDICRQMTRGEPPPKQGWLAALCARHKGVRGPAGKNKVLLANREDSAILQMRKPRAALSKRRARQGALSWQARPTVQIAEHDFTSGSPTRARASPLALSDRRGIPRPRGVDGRPRPVALGARGRHPDPRAFATGNVQAAALWRCRKRPLLAKPARVTRVLEGPGGAGQAG